jgi:hypothetical protein
MVFGFFDMVNSEGFSWRRGLGFVVWIVFWLWFVFLGLLQPVVGLRPLRERARSWGDEVCIGIWCFCFWLIVGWIRFWLEFVSKNVNLDSKECNSDWWSLLLLVLSWNFQWDWVMIFVFSFVEVSSIAFLTCSFDGVWLVNSIVLHLGVCVSVSLKMI